MLRQRWNHSHISTSLQSLRYEGMVPRKGCRSPLTSSTDHCTLFARCTRRTAIGRICDACSSILSDGTLPSACREAIRLTGFQAKVGSYSRTWIAQIKLNLPFYRGIAKRLHDKLEEVALSEGRTLLASPVPPSDRHALTPAAAARYPGRLSSRKRIPKTRIQRGTKSYQQSGAKRADTAAFQVGRVEDYAFCPLTGKLTEGVFFAKPLAGHASRVAQVSQI